ncbi:MAG: hypothetical protein R2839_06980 [Thermomicrobiales bacterium]
MPPLPGLDWRQPVGDFFDWCCRSDAGGGGIGWLVGKHGMSITTGLRDGCHSRDGESCPGKAQSNADLFWALRGGGGGFGVVTELEFALHEREMRAGGLPRLSHR